MADTGVSWDQKEGEAAKYLLEYQSDRGSEAPRCTPTITEDRQCKSDGPIATALLLNPCRSEFIFSIMLLLVLEKNVYN